MRTIVITNQKGGIGKTTTALALTALLQKDGHRTLLIDADPQGNATDTYGAQVHKKETLYDVLLDASPCAIADAVQYTDLGDIVASDPLLRKADEVLAGEINGMYRLSEALEGLSATYDYVVIDTAPAINMLLYNCLIAADDVVVPVAADRYSITGLSQLHEVIQAIRKRQKPSLRLAGLLLLKYSGRTNLSKDARSVLESTAHKLGTKLFATGVRECVRCQEAQAAKQSLFQYAPSCTTALDYQNFYHEFLTEEK